MKMHIKRILIVGLIVLVTGCTSTTGGYGESAAIDGSVAGSETGTGYDPNNPNASSYGYGAGQTPSGQSFSGPGATQSDRVVYFDFDSAEVRADSLPVVESHAQYLLSNPSAVVILEGHTDERGTREYNIALGERRGDSVRRIMSAYGVGPQQIRVVSYGEERPAVAGYDESSYGLNRRVEIVY